MYVLLFDVFKHILLRKTDVLQTCRKKKFAEMHELWRAKRNKVHSGKRLFWHYYLQLPFVYRTVSQISFKLFSSGDKIGFYQISLEYEADFRDIMNVFPNILVKNQISKNETRFFRWKSTNNNNINIFLSLENPCTYLLTKEKTWKRIFNTNGELSQNRTEKNKIMSFKATCKLAI